MNKPPTEVTAVHNVGEYWIFNAVTRIRHILADDGIQVEATHPIWGHVYDAIHECHEADHA